jgi:hypothetical protein
MFMKKGITFIATLLILACVALAGSSAWAALTIKPEDVIVYDKSDPNQAPYTKISLNNLKVYYTGTYSGTADPVAISFNLYRYGTPTDDGEPTYEFAKRGTVNPTSYPNVCSVSGGAVKGNFSLTEDDLVYGNPDPVTLKRPRGVKLDVYFVVNGAEICQKSFFIAKNETAPARVTEPPTTFLPEPGSEIRGFFTTSIEVHEDYVGEGVTADPNYDVYSWVKTKKSSETSDDKFTNAAKSSQFGNPAYLTLNAQSFTKGTEYDMKLVTKDIAANLVAVDSIDTDSKNVKFTGHATIEGDDAYTNIKINDDGTLQYQVYIPIGAFASNTPPASGDCVYNIGGRVLGDTTGNIAWQYDSTGKLAILNIGGAQSTVAADFTDYITLRSTAGLTVGMPGTGSGPYTYFGATDRIGPVLLKAQIDVDEHKTILTFSEPLDKSITLDKADFQVGGSSYKDLYPSGSIAYDTASDNKIILGVEVGAGDQIKVIENNHLRDKNAIHPNKALVIPATVLLGRKLEKVEVIGVDASHTYIEITFNGSMDSSALKAKDNYWVSLAPGLEDAADADVKNNRIKVGTATIVNDTDNRSVILTINDRITDTSASGLPKVTITDDGMENLKGSTTGETLISNNKGVDSTDKVGPYIRSAAYNRHATDKQAAADKSTYHVMTLTFSEPVQCQYLYSPRTVFSLTDADSKNFGYDSTFMQTSGLASKVDIRMGEDKSALGDDLEGIPDGAYININSFNTDMIKDAAGNGTSNININGTWHNACFPVAISDPTIPWITQVTTRDNDNNGKIDALILTWNEPIAKEFSNKALSIANTKIKDGYSMDPNVPSWDDRNPIIINSSNNRQVIVPLNEKGTIDTSATPGLTLYLDSQNYFIDTSTPVDSVYHKADKTIEILSSAVTDGVGPYPVAVNYRKTGNTSVSGNRAAIYAVTVRYSEAIDPNVYGSTGDSSNDASKDFVARTVSEYSYTDINDVTTTYNVIDDGSVPSGITIGKYLTTSCHLTDVVFYVTVVGNDNEMVEAADGTMVPTTEALLRTLTFVPSAGTGARDTIKDSGVFDPTGNFALAVGDLGSGDTGHAVLAAGEVTFIGSTDPIAPHTPARTASFMMLYGTILNTDGSPIGSGWSIYAYSLDNLYRFKHRSRYPLSVTKVDDPQHDIYLSKAESDPNCVKDDPVTAILAPANAVNGVGDEGGVCYGSCAVQSDGHYTLNAYGAFFDNQGFNEGDPMFLVVQAPNGGKKYLVTNNSKSDAEFYLTFSQQNDGIKQYNIDLRNYESKELSNGWNFISFSTLKRYVLNGAASSGGVLLDEMNNPLGQSTCPMITVSSLSNVLTSVYGQWGKMYFVDGGRDATSAIRITSRDPKTGVESGSDKIEYFSIGYGYWIYIPSVKSGAELVVLGKKVTDNDPMYHMALKKNDSLNGVNMVGYWGGNVYYVVDPPQDTIKFSSLVKDANGNLKADMKTSVDNIGDVFEAFNSGIRLVRSSYENGSHSWLNPIVYGSDLSILSDLIYVGPGYGYYMVVNQDCNISWPVVNE